MAGWAAARSRNHSARKIKPAAIVNMCSTCSRRRRSGSTGSPPGTARCTGLGPDRYARHANTSRKVRGHVRQLEDSMRSQADYAVVQAVRFVPVSLAVCG